MTTDELRTAAETILRCVSKTETDLGPRYERNDQSGMGLQEAWELAADYLATHRPDDDLTWDCDWLITIGGVHGSAWVNLVGTHTTLTFTFLLDDNSEEVGIENHGGSGPWVPCRTRGQVRHLCAVLGIKLEEA